MAEPDNRRTDGAAPTHVHIEKKRTNWLAWIALLAGILALLFALSRCNRHDDVAAAPPAGDNTVVAQTANAPQATPLGVSGLGGYLGGNAATPATFTFEKINFDTARSDIRPQDQAEVTQVAAVLKQYGNSHVGSARYADARGSEPANEKLGKDRAEAVKAALVREGIDAGRIATASGGESDPVGTNATAGGQAENRRTELVVTQR